MSNPVNVTSRYSFRRLTMWVLVSVVSVTVLLCAFLALHEHSENAHKRISRKIVVIGEILSANLSQDVQQNNSEAASARLESLSASELVTNAHVYWLNNTDEVVFFTSYNRQGRAVIEQKISEINRLKKPQPTRTDDMYEWVSEIKQPNADGVATPDGETLGYLYIRAVEQVSGYELAESILYYVLIMVMVCLVGALISLRVLKLSSRPLLQITEILHAASRDKDYSRRASYSDVKEIDQLVKAVNVLMSRIEALLVQQQEADAQHKKLNASLEQIVNQRTVALKEANQELIQTLEKLHQFQRQIVQNEKMASLGDMVAGVAHEVNTPIGLGVTASTMMLDRLVNIKQQFESKTLKASTMARFIDEGQENLNIIYRNLNRAAELISSFKQVAVDQTSESSRVFNVKQLINEILLSLRPRLKKTRHQVIVNCVDDMIVETKAGPINQIVINLIVNSLLHAFEDGKQGVITLTLSMLEGDTLKLVYTDDGAGIPKTIRKRIFDPFVTTKRGQGGSGLGMHLVYNLVTQALNGSITLTSEEGQGVEFTILFPVKTANT